MLKPLYAQTTELQPEIDLDLALSESKGLGREVRFQAAKILYAQIPGGIGSITTDLAAAVRGDSPYYLWHGNIFEAESHVALPGRYWIPSLFSSSKVRSSLYALMATKGWSETKAMEQMARSHTGLGHSAIALTAAAMAEFDSGTRQEQLAKIKGMSRYIGQPTLVVWSGGRSCHVYWAYTKPLWGDDPKRLEIQRWLLGILSADPAIDNLGRLMRLPGYSDANRRQPVLELRPTYVDPDQMLTTLETMAGKAGFDLARRDLALRNLRYCATLLGIARRATERGQTDFADAVSGLAGRLQANPGYPSEEDARNIHRAIRKAGGGGFSHQRSGDKYLVPSGAVQALTAGASSGRCNCPICNLEDLAATIITPTVIKCWRCAATIVEDTSIDFASATMPILDDEQMKVWQGQRAEIATTEEDAWVAELTTTREEEDPWAAQYRRGEALWALLGEDGTRDRLEAKQRRAEAVPADVRRAAERARDAAVQLAKRLQTEWKALGVRRGEECLRSFARLAGADGSLGSVAWTCRSVNCLHCGPYRLAEKAYAAALMPPLLSIKDLGFRVIGVPMANRPIWLQSIPIKDLGAWKDAFSRLERTPAQKAVELEFASLSSITKKKNTCLVEERDANSGSPAIQAAHPSFGKNVWVAALSGSTAKIISTVPVRRRGDTEPVEIDAAKRLQTIVGLIIEAHPVVSGLTLDGEAPVPQVVDEVVFKGKSKNIITSAAALHLDPQGLSAIASPSAYTLDGADSDKVCSPGLAQVRFAQAEIGCVVRGQLNGLGSPSSALAEGLTAVERSKIRSALAPEPDEKDDDTPAQGEGVLDDLILW